MSKNKVNLEVISRRENITARAIVKGNTVTFAYDKENERVSAVAFSVHRGTETQGQYGGVEAFRGSMYGEAFNVENNAYHIGDSLVYEEIFKICKEIINPEIQNDTSV